MERITRILQDLQTKRRLFPLRKTSNNRFKRMRSESKKLFPQDFLMTSNLPKSPHLNKNPQFNSCKIHHQPGGKWAKRLIDQVHTTKRSIPKDLKTTIYQPDIPPLDHQVLLKIGFRTQCKISSMWSRKGLKKGRKIEGSLYPILM